MGNVFTFWRTAATAIVAGLASASTIYPHDTWIQIALAAFATLGIHAVPSVGQLSSPAASPAAPSTNA